MIVNNEQCVVGATIPSWWHATSIARDGVHTTRTPLSRQTQNTKGARCVTCVLAELRAHYTTHATPKQEKRRKARRGEKRRGKENKKRTERIMLGGGARLADAATRHHLTQTQQNRKERREQR